MDIALDGIEYDDVRRARRRVCVRLLEGTRARAPVQSRKEGGRGHPRRVPRRWQAGEIDMECHFCDKKYKFTAKEALALFDGVTEKDEEKK